MYVCMYVCMPDNCGSRSYLQVFEKVHAEARGHLKEHTGCNRQRVSDVFYPPYRSEGGVETTHRVQLRVVPNEQKKIKIRDIFVVNRIFFCRESRQKNHDSWRQFF